jgi:hypothetical protein
MYRVLSIFLVFLYCSSLYSLPVVDVVKYLKRANMVKEDVNSFLSLSSGYKNQVQSTMQGKSEQVDAMDNGFSNMIARNVSAMLSVSNQSLQESSQPLDICDTYALSHSYNDIVCESLSDIYDSTTSYVMGIHNSNSIYHNADAYKVADPMTVAVTSSPVIKSDYSVIKKNDLLREEAFKSSVYTVIKSVKSDEENGLNPLLNSAQDDFSGVKLKNTQEHYGRSQLYRSIAVMKAKMLSAQLDHYKQSLQKEFVLALELSQSLNNR